MIDHENVRYLKTLPGVKYLVLDEADRMIELGQFKEISKVLNFLYTQCLADQMKMNQALKGGDLAGEKSEEGNEEEDMDNELVRDEDMEGVEGEEEMEEGEEEMEDEEEEMEDGEEEMEDQEDMENGEEEMEGEEDGEHSVEYEDVSDDGELNLKNVTILDSAGAVSGDLVLTPKEIEVMTRDSKRRRTFVVSATIGTSFWTSRMMNKHVRKETKKKRKTDENYNPKIAEILDKLTFNYKTKTIDLTKDQLLPTNLEIMKVNCHHDEKLLYLTHFVRTFNDSDIIIFTNSIPATKKIRAILETMNIDSVNLHSQQQVRHIPFLIPFLYLIYIIF